MNAPSATLAHSIELPRGESAESRRAFVTPERLTSVRSVDLDPDGQAVVVELGEVPLGTKEIYVQHRMAGDFYCFIHGKRQVSATGATREEAFTQAVKLAA